MFSIAPYFTSLKEYADYLEQCGSKKLCPARCNNCGKSGNPILVRQIEKIMAMIP